MPIDLSPDPTYKELTMAYAVCEGRGQVSTRGEMDAHLFFTFTSRNDSATLQFRDLLGRRTLSMFLSPFEVEVRDWQNNATYSSETIQEMFPFFRILEPTALIHLLWGLEPSVKDDMGNALSDLAGTLDFKAEKTEYGTLVNLVDFQLDNGNSSITIEIQERQFGPQSSPGIETLP